MPIRRQILIFLVVIGLALVGMAATVAVAVRTLTGYVERVDWANQQLVAMAGIAVQANRFSEQIAEVLLLGPVERADFNDARGQLARSLASLERRTAAQVEAMPPGPVRDEEAAELETVARMRALFRELDAAVAPLLELDRDGRRSEALALFRSAIENRLDAEFERLISRALRGEREEVAAVEAEATALAWRLGFGVAAVAVVLLVLSSGAALALARALARPIDELTEGAMALGRGDLSRRIGFKGADELGLLARRFNEMADELGRQRALLLEARSDLERQVAERTGELEHANRLLRDLDQHRVQFLAEISHELRTPLTVLRGEAEIALRPRVADVEAWRDTLQRIVAQAAVMGRLVDDLLFLARAEADQIRFDRRKIELSELVAETVRDGAVLGRARAVAIRASVPDRPLTVDADGLRLKQALLVALDNAVKHSRPGQSVTVALAETGGHAELSIEDHGAGIPAKDLPFVLERFYRGGADRGRADGGSGLGLAIARWIVEKHEGEISVESVRGAGTTVRFRLPRAA